MSRNGSDGLFVSYVDSKKPSVPRLHLLLLQGTLGLRGKFVMQMREAVCVTHLLMQQYGDQPLIMSRYSGRNFNLFGKVSFLSLANSPCWRSPGSYPHYK